MAPAGALQSNEILGDDVQLFVDGACYKDIQQGQIGDCWLISAISALAEYDMKLLENIFGDSISNWAPGQEIDMQLYDRVQQQWVTLTIKDKFPVDESDRPCYARPADGLAEAWVMFLEKAFASLFGGKYSALNGGFPWVALECMTGCSTVDWLLRDQDDCNTWHAGTVATPSAMDEATYHPCNETASSDQLFQYISNADANGELICCGTLGSDSDQSNGIVLGHAYTICKAYTASDGGRLLAIRNPWASDTEWKGGFSDSDLAANHPELLEELEAALGAECCCDDGIFWMAVEDFVQYFADVQIVNVCSQTSQLDQCCDKSNVVGSSMHAPCDGDQEDDNL